MSGFREQGRKREGKGAGEGSNGGRQTRRQIGGKLGVSEREGKVRERKRDGGTERGEE